jgi:PAS domain S-box-containing protein
MVYRCRLDAPHQMLFASQGSIHLTGYRPKDLVDGRYVSYWDLVNGHDREAVSREIEEAAASYRPYHCIYRLTTADGQERWVLDIGQVVPASEGMPAVCEGFASDRTEHLRVFQRLEKQAAERLRKLDALYDILQVAADSSGLEATLIRTLHRIIKAGEARAGAIHLLEQSNTVLKMVAQQGLPEDVGRALELIPVVEDALFGWIIRHNQRLHIPQAVHDPRTMSLSEGTSSQTYLGVPIAANERLLGVLTVLTRDLTHHTAEEEIELVESVAEEIGIVVENAHLRQRAEKLMVLEERNRLARELHDSVTQSLYGVTLFAEAGLNLADAGKLESAGQLFDEVLKTGQQALKEMRLLVHKLRPSVLEKEGLVRALRHRLNAVEGRAGVKSQLIVEETGEMAPDLEEALYHISQEALNNAIKHAAASSVEVRLWQNAGDEIELIVIDDGQGFDLEAAAEAGGLGLTSIRERASRLGGTCEVKSAPGTGTTVRVCFPRQA